MAKDKIAYVCENCGQESAKWIGKCPSCNEWNTFREIRIKADSAQQSLRHVSKSATAPLLLKDIPLQDVSRMDMRDEELNRVLTSTPRHWERRETIEVSGRRLPFSHRATVERVTYNRSASSRWVRPFSSLSFFNVSASNILILFTSLWG